LFTGCASIAQQKDPDVVQKSDEVHGQLDPAVVDAPEVEAYLQQVGRRIIDAARELEAEGFEREGQDIKTSAWMFSDDIKFHLVNNPKINAVATGGKHMYIFNGFLQECQSEEELAAVMAHEFGHVYGRHVQRGEQRKEFMSGLRQGVVQAFQGDQATATPDKQMEGEVAGAVVDFGNGLFAPTPTRDEEKHADRLGFAFYVRAGYDPERFADLFQAQLDKGTTDKQGLDAFLNDHPGLRERVVDAQKAAQNLPPDAADWRKPPTASPVKLRKVKEKAAEAVASMPETDALEKAKGLLGAFPSCFSDEDDHD
jgi:predicted Zn-dependent protease